MGVGEARIGYAGRQAGTHVMNDDAAQRPWLGFRIAGSDPGGADARDLARLLADIVSAARVIVDEALALGRRPGPMSKLERSLAAFRVVSVSPGSLSIALAEPPASASNRASMQPDHPLAPDTVARELVEEMESISRGELSPSGGYARRQSVERLMRSAARIGDVVDVAHYPSEGRKMRARVELTRVVLVTDAAPAPATARATRNGAVFGPGYTPYAANKIQRLRRQLHLRDLERRSVAYPPRSIAELARAQGVDLLNPPDYPAILAGLWETEKEAAAFREEIRKGRSASR